ncbi:MAG: agl cluster protein AglQ [Anaerolineae bacterium]|nr:agl cluster protein AglQ [Anaerolineae bacterium]
MKLYDILTHSAEAALRLQRADGSLPPGHNGPYQDPETPVRTTAHWLLTFLKAYQITQAAPYLQAVQNALRYLCQPELRPAGGTFVCRSKAGKDACNGLIGQVRALEALIAGAPYAPDDIKPLAVAEAVFRAHPYDQALHLWQRVEPDGQVLSVSMAFNQQLWFAAMGALLAAHMGASIQQQVSDFMDAVPNHLQLYPSGLVYHRLKLPGSALQALKWHLIERRHAADRKERAVGYHAFTLYAFALLKQQYPQHPIWESPAFQKALAHTRSQAYEQSVAGNKYGYAYNPLGFEVAFVLEVFGGESTRSEQVRWVQRQLKDHLNAQTHRMTEHTSDPETLASRLYEAASLSNLAL